MQGKQSLETAAIRSGQERSQFGEHAEALYLTSSFVFKSAAQAAARFSGQEKGNTYSRFTNPTVSMLNERLASLEGSAYCLSTGSGMSAILSVMLGLLKQGDRVVSTGGIFGATHQLLGTWLPRWGIDVEFVDGNSFHEFEQALSKPVNLVFIETPTNPLTEIIDIEKLSFLAKKNGAKVVVDNSFCTPVLQKPLNLGADIVVYSSTKLLEGQGRVLGGAICLNDLDIQEAIFSFLRTAGPSLSPFNAWVILKGLETLSLRVHSQSSKALDLATRLERHPRIVQLFYPGLSTHPHYEVAKKQQSAGGCVVAFEVEGDKEAAWQVIDHAQILSITANVGDTKSTITHPATTTHGRLSPQARATSGIKDNLIRISVGLECVDDLERDILRGLEA